MKLFVIKSWYSGRVLFSLETSSMKLCVEAAIKSDAVLRGADLRDADLRGADLRGADLSGADLRGAVLRDAVLRDAVLRDADLRDADLSGADLRDADLRGADLSGAVLRDADLRGAVFDIEPASKEQAVKNLDTVREIILDKEERLYMGDWHQSDEWVGRTCLQEAECGTGHCLAGWLQVCSTDEKIRKLSAFTAGILLAPIASHMFYKTNNEVLSWLKDREYAE